MVTSPAVNKIHSLPVIVNYHLPSSSSTFTTLLSSTQQVYVHPSIHSKDGEEIWGSVYLKQVAQGILMASPELHPFQSNSQDSSLYVLDPRETYSRRQRSLISSTSSSASSTSNEVWAGKGLLSWALNEGGSGKNLVVGKLICSSEFSRVPKEGLDAMQALMMADMAEEKTWGLEMNLALKGQGQSFSGGLAGNVMGRSMSTQSNLTTTPEIVNTPAEGVNGLVARRGITSRLISTPAVAGPSQRSSPVPGPTLTPNQPARAVKARNSSGRKKKAPIQPRKEPLHVIDTNKEKEDKDQSTEKDAVQLIKQPVIYPSIPAAVYNNPASLTTDQAQRLLASPAFLDLLEKTAAGTAGTSGNSKKRKLQNRNQNLNTSDETLGSSGMEREPSSGGEGLKEIAKIAKRVKHELEQKGDNGDCKCWNCGRTKSSVWRSRLMEDGTTVRVCNACGLYWNTKKEMRPPNMWSAVDDDVPERPNAQKPRKSSFTTNKLVPNTFSTPATTPQQLGTPRLSGVGNIMKNPPSSGFKRTLSSVVEMDAKRIANHRGGNKVSNLAVGKIGGVKEKENVFKNVMTSPAQSTRSKTVQIRSNGNTIRKFEVPQNPSRGSKQAASSPGIWVTRTPTQSMLPPTSDGFQPIFSGVEESPNTLISKFLNSHVNLQALQSTKPTTASQHHQDESAAAQSDSGLNAAAWSTDISTLFDVDAFSESLDPSNSNQSPLRRSPRKQLSSHRSKCTMSIPTTSKSRENERNGMIHSESTSEEDLISNLFNSDHPSPSPIKPGQQDVVIEMNNENDIELCTFDFSALPPSSPPVPYETTFNRRNVRKKDSPGNCSPLSFLGLSPMDQNNVNGNIGSKVQGSGLKIGFTPNESGNLLTPSANIMERVSSAQSNITTFSNSVENTNNVDMGSNQGQRQETGMVMTEEGMPELTLEEIQNILNNNNFNMDEWATLLNMENNDNHGSNDHSALYPQNGQYGSDTTYIPINGDGIGAKNMSMNMNGMEQGGGMMVSSSAQAEMMLDNGDWFIPSN